jgi:hypothetical protein
MSSSNVPRNATTTPSEFVPTRQASVSSMPPTKAAGGWRKPAPA